MPKADHYAILLAINTYPGLSNLEGPENDIAAFAAWLKDPQGGDVVAENIKTILSSDFPPVLDPYDANPTMHTFKRILNGMVRDQQTWRNRVGERLYLYFAGHGFTPGTNSITDPALFTAEAQDGDTAHIAGLRFASRVRNAGFFDEIVLIMDCCQGVLRTGRVEEPTWSPPDNQKSAQVKLFEAYGAPRGKAAFERPISPGGPTHGVFSKVLIEALKTAKPDNAGYVTGTILKNQFLQIWNGSYKAEFEYDPPIRPPEGQDIRLFQHTNYLNTLPPVEFRLIQPLPGAGMLDVFDGGNMLIVSLPTDNLTPQVLTPGLYKAIIRETSRRCMFEVTGVSRQTVEL